MSDQHDERHQIGHLELFQKDDPIFDSYNAAIDAAMQKSQDDESAFGIWHYDTGELVAIVHEGTLFTP